MARRGCSRPRRSLLAPSLNPLGSCLQEGLLAITWAGGGFSLVEVGVVALIILCGDWRRFAADAKARQEADSQPAAADAEGGDGGESGGAAAGGKGHPPTAQPRRRTRARDEGRGGWGAPRGSVGLF